MQLPPTDLFDASTPEPAPRAGLLERAPDDRLDALVRLAAAVFQVPIAVVTLTSEGGEPRTVARVPAGAETAAADDPLLLSCVRRIAASGEPLLFPDLDAAEPDDVAAGAETELGAYAGVALRGADARLLGVVSIADREPREWGARELEILAELAALAAPAIEERSGSAAPHPSEQIDPMLERFRILVEHSLAGIYVVQGDRVTYVNPKLAEIFGYTPAELIAVRSMEDLVLPADRAEVMSNIGKRLAGELENVSYGFRGVRSDGEVIEVQVLGNRIEIGGEPAVIGMLLDVTEQKRSAEMLREREAHFRSLLENAWDIIHELDSGGVIRYISPSVERVLGYRPEEMVGRPGADFVHPDDVDAVSRSFAETITRPGATERLELRLRHRDGSWRTGEVQARVIQHGTEPPIAIVNTHDVTDARQIEAALRENEERYRLVARATNSAIRDWNLRTGECSWIAASNILLRYSPEEIGDTVEWWYERIHPDDRKAVVNGIQGAIDGVGDSWSAEYRFLRGNGEYAAVLDCCHIARSERGVPVRVLGSLVDVTERRRAEDAQRFLAQASALLSEDLDLNATLAALARLTLPTLADYCLIDLVEGPFLRRVGSAHVDPTRESLFLQGEYHTLDGDPDRHPVIRVVRSQEPVLVTECTDTLLRTISHDDDHLDRLREMGLCSFMIVPLLAHGKTLGVITLAASDSRRHFAPRDLLVAQDLARRAGMAIEHAQLFRQSQEAIASREEILGVVSHDLRNPLNTIRLSAELMLDGSDERRATNLQSLERIRRASTQMETMIADLLDMSSIEAGRFTVERSPFPVQALIEEADDMFRPLAEERSIRLETVVEDAVYAVEIDARQILRVFSNLVGNAIKFTPPGGTITLRAVQVGTSMHFSVADTGPGIPGEQLSHVFERYWQARAGDRRGAGLGLTIAREIVEAHGGQIWARNGREGGAELYFSIPVASEG